MTMWTSKIGLMWQNAYFSLVSKCWFMYNVAVTTQYWSFPSLTGIPWRLIEGCEYWKDLLEHDLDYHYGREWTYLRWLREYFLYPTQLLLLPVSFPSFFLPLLVQRTKSRIHAASSSCTVPVSQLYLSPHGFISALEKRVFRKMWPYVLFLQIYIIYIYIIYTYNIYGSFTWMAIMIFILWKGILGLKTENTKEFSHEPPISIWSYSPETQIFLLHPA